MGQNQSLPSKALQANTSKRGPNNSITIPSPKTIEILVDDEIFKIVIYESLTCGWLLSETIRLYKGTKTIVALETKEHLDILDEWLLRFEKSLKPFSDHDQLIAVFARPVSGLSLNAFTLIKNVGIGENAKIMLARKKDTGILYAIKAVNKEEVSNKGKSQKVQAEKNILSQISHPFIVKLYWVFQSELMYYFVMGYCAGGELNFHLRKIGRFTENQAKFYFSEILVALEYLHGKNVVYNNLKAENVLLDIDGHIKLADFGLATEVLTQEALAYTFGSQEPLNPEIIKENNLKKSPDFYSLGCLLYQMLTGVKVFYTYSGEVKGEVLNLPRYLSSNVKSLLEGLLCKDQNLRLGSNGIEAVKSHVWCEGIIWQKVLKKKLVPPFRPNLKTPNFSPDILEMPLNAENFEENEYEICIQPVEKSEWSTPEIVIFESNNVVFSERTSTDTEDPFNSICVARSLDTSSLQVKANEYTGSFTLPTSEGKNSEIKSLSPEAKNEKKKFSSIKTLLRSFTDLPKFFAEDSANRHRREMLTLQIPNFQTDLGRMQEVLRKKINSKNNV